MKPTGSWVVSLVTYNSELLKQSFIYDQISNYFKISLKHCTQKKIVLFKKSTTE